jgi:hypothetical protein
MSRLFRLRFAAALAVAVGVVVSSPAPRAQAPAGQAAAAPSAPVTLPAKLSDADFWKLSTEFSEPNGYFRSDNLLSNEVWFQYLVPELKAYLPKDGVYLGVGPEQNFTYIAALEPRMVIIFDIRRGNLHTHLMYKALFELAKDRADFVSLLFSRQRPAELTKESTVQQIFTAVAAAPTSQERYKENLKRITDHLTKTRSLPLVPEDLNGIDYVYGNFHYFGPGINYNSSSSGGGGRGAMSTYASLMTATDGNNVSRSYLANDELFSVMKRLHEKNLLVPVVGDFAGPKAIRSVGKYLKAANATVTAFYLSNVEQYLGQNGVWQNFCNNFASLPLNEKSTFIYSQNGGGGGGGGGLNSYYRPMLADVKAYNCVGGEPK